MADWDAEKQRLYVRFGTHETDEMPLEWAEKMLAELKNAHPVVFGKLLQAAIGIDTKPRGSGR